MRTFADNAGRTWTVAINVDAVKRVRHLAGVNLLEIVEGTLIEKLIRDPVLLCDVVYAACKPEADARGITDEEFGRSMAGDAIEQATAALLEDLVGFFPSRKDRENLTRVLATTRRVMDRARDLIARRLDSGAIEQAAEQALADGSQPGNVTSSSGDVPGSSE